MRPMMNPRMQEVMNQFLNASIGIEVIYSFVIIICSLMVYFGTKELYELTNHKGIKYFRLSFLFFAISYFFRSFIKILVSFFGVAVFREVPQYFGLLITFLFIYASSISVFYLFYSLICKRWENKIIIFHLISLILGLVIVLSHNSLIYLIINIILFLVLTTGVYIAHKSNHLIAK